MNKIILSLTVLSLLITNVSANMRKVDKTNKTQEELRPDNLFNKRKALNYGVGTYQNEGILNTHIEIGTEFLHFLTGSNFSYGIYSNLGFTKASKKRVALDNSVGLTFNFGAKANYNIFHKFDIFFGLGGVYGVSNTNTEANGIEIRTGMGYDLNEKFYLSTEYVKPFLSNSLSPNIYLIKLGIKY